jgi:hypothetical protein
MRELSVDEFHRALRRYGFAVSGNRIFDISRRCPGGSWLVVLNATFQIDRHRTIRMAVQERTVEMARRNGAELRSERKQAR